jgi:hypothetical protein
MVMPDRIPENIRQFILEKIDTVAQLEGLLLFHANPDKHMDVQEIAKRLYIDEAEARLFLSQLALQGFLGVDQSFYIYKPVSPALNAMTGELAKIYSRSLVPLTKLIHSKNKVQKFADAFRMRKD